MIVVRDVFQARYGKGDELVALMKEMMQASPPGSGPAMRILTDRSGPFFTVVTETQVESMGEWERMMAESFGDARFEGLFARMVPLVESGRREFYHVEA